MFPSDALVGPGSVRHDELLRDAARRPHRRVDGRRGAAPRRTPRRPLLDRSAVRDIAPVTVSVAPFGLVVGGAVGTGGVPAVAGLVATPLMYGGSAQLAALELLGGGAGVLAVLATVAVVNARLLLYGAALAPRFADQPGWFRWGAPLFLVDQTYALATGRDLRSPSSFRRYWLTVGAVLGVGWVTAVAVGALFGPALAGLGPLRLAAPACFVALLVPRLVDRSAVAAAIVAATVAALTATAPRGIGLLAGAVAGLIVGVLSDHRRPAAGRGGASS